jgi:hypothetical protein
VITAAADPGEVAAAALAPLGPLRVTPGTRPLLVGALAVVLLLLALLAVLLLVTARRLAALERAAADEDGRLPGPAAPQP